MIQQLKAFGLCIKLARLLDDRYLSSEDSDFVDKVQEDLDQFIKSGHSLDRVLLFPPVNNYLRLLIHKAVEDYRDLHSFSVGEGSARRTVVCWEDALISNTGVDMSVYRPPMMRGRGRARQRDSNSPNVGQNSDGMNSPDRWSHDRYNINEDTDQPVYNRPGYRSSPVNIRKKENESFSIPKSKVEDSNANTSQQTPKSAERPRARNKRPDMQVYVPRARRSQDSSQTKSSSSDRCSPNLSSKKGSNHTGIPETTSQPVSQQCYQDISMVSSTPVSSNEHRQLDKNLRVNKKLKVLDRRKDKDVLGEDDKMTAEENFTDSASYLNSSLTNEMNVSESTCQTTKCINEFDTAVEESKRTNVKQLDRTNSGRDANSIETASELSGASVKVENETLIKHLDEEKSERDLTFKDINSKHCGVIAESNEHFIFISDDQNDAKNSQEVCQVNHNQLQHWDVQDMAHSDNTTSDELVIKCNTGASLAEQSHNPTFCENSESAMISLCDTDTDSCGNARTVLPESNEDAGWANNIPKGKVDVEINEQLKHENTGKNSEIFQRETSSTLVSNNTSDFAHKGQVLDHQLDIMNDADQSSLEMHQKPDIKSADDETKIVGAQMVETDLMSIVSDCNNGNAKETVSEPIADSMSGAVDLKVKDESERFDVSECTMNDEIKTDAEDSKTHIELEVNSGHPNETCDQIKNVINANTDTVQNELDDTSDLERTSCIQNENKIEAESDNTERSKNAVEEIKADVDKMSNTKQAYDTVKAVSKMSESEVTISDSVKDDDKEMEIEEDSWDSMFNEDGDCLDPSAMEELTKTVGKVKIQKSKKINYLDYQPKDKAELDYSEYGHIIEIYDFPAEFVTRDLITAFQGFLNRGFDLKWVDDTHALGVFSSNIAAQDAVSLVHPLIKVRPLSMASQQSRTKARRCSEFLQPHKPRPETSASAARRLVAGALGIATNVSKEKRERERQQLKEAKEKRRKDRQNRVDIWEYGKCAMDEES